ncbi:hypothetical protein ES705_24038 [subsurface metagenome]
MARLEEHEVLHLIDRVKLGLDRSSALAKLILHCRIVLDNQYDDWETRLKVINQDSKIITETLFARGIYNACSKYDETWSVPFHLFAAYFVITAIRRETEQIVYKHSGIVRQRECKYMPPEDANSSWSFDEYSCGNQCGWKPDDEHQEKYNRPRPCKVYYTPPKPKPDQLLQKLQEREPKYLLRPGSTTGENVVAGKNKAEGAGSIQHTLFVSLDDTQKNDKGEDGSEPRERYMFEFLQQEFQLNPVEDANISGIESHSEKDASSRLENLPKLMKGIITDLCFGINGVFNVDDVAWKHGITPDEVMETVVACIQRLKRLGST